MYNEEIKAFAQRQEQKLIASLGHSREHSDPSNEVRNRDDYQREYSILIFISATSGQNAAV